MPDDAVAGVQTGMFQDNKNLAERVQAGGADFATADNALSARFGAPPFTVLDARQDYWTKRKRTWLGLGIKSELGRDVALFNPKLYGEAYGNSSAGSKMAVRSVFDPVLCELMYEWFCPPHGRILDPFAGGSVRGIVAARKGHPYVGVDLRIEQVEANQHQWTEIAPKLVPKWALNRDDLESNVREPLWVAGDSRNLNSPALPKVDGKYDFIFSCPPYFNLEVYSKDERDLSLCASYGEFVDAHTNIIRHATELLEDNRFAGWVMGNIRDKEGCIVDMVGDTVRAFEKAGLRYYNDGILVNPFGTMPLRAARHFNAGRKLERGHQTVLIFWKGKGKPITQIKKQFPVLDDQGSTGALADPTLYRGGKDEPEEWAE